jgi:F0F1-type ATP synthase membrane subunit b/b'
MINSNQSRQQSRQPRSLGIFVPAPLIEFHPLLIAEGGLHPGIPKAINLAIFITVLYLLLRKPAREFFARRFASVREMLEKAAREKKEAEAKMAEIDARLNHLDAEVAGIKAQAEREAAAERARMETEAKKDIERIRLSAQREIESAKQVAMADLRDFAAVKAVDLAEQMIRRELTPEDDAKLLQRVGDELSKV